MDILSPTGIEKPAGGELHSRAQYLRNLDRINQVAIDRENNTGKPFAHMGRTNVFQALGGVTTKILFEAAQVLTGGFTFSDADDAIIIPKAGRYTVRTKGFFSGGSSANNQTGITVNGVISPSGQYQTPTSSANKDTSGADIMVHGSGTCTFALNDKVGLWQNSSVSAWGTNGYDGSWLELEWSGV